MKKTKENTETNEAETQAKENASGRKSVAKVGGLLKEMRLEKGLRLVDVSKKLCIRKLYLEAIEESNYDEIPAFPYGVGFIRSYAEYLGLNANNIVELYKEEANTATDKDIYVLEPQSEANVPGRKYLILSLIAIVLIYVAWSLYTNNTSEDKTMSDVTVGAEEVEKDSVSGDDEYVSSTEVMETIKNAEPVAVTEETSNQVIVTEESFVEDAPEAENKPSGASEMQDEVVVRVIEETWVEVKSDSKLYLSKVLAPGTEYVVPGGGKGMILSIGKVDGAEIYINGKLTQVANPNKKTNIVLDPFLAANH